VKKSKFSEEQIVRLLKEVEAPRTPRLEGRDVKKVLSRAQRISMSLATQTEHGLSARQSCRVLRLSRSVLYYRPRPRNDDVVIEAVSVHIAENPGQGFGLLYRTLRANEPPCGKTRLWRVYRELKLNRPRRGKKRLPSRVREPLSVPLSRNDTWSADFMSDALWSGRRFRTFNVIDDFNRLALKIEIDTSLPALRILRALDEWIEVHGTPRHLRIDNGPELVSQVLKEWAQRQGIELVFIQPGRPTQNAYIERFNRTYRTEVLDRYVFHSLYEVRTMTEDWRKRYNEERPHTALGNVPPVRSSWHNDPDLYF
jgi:putative transposase